VKLSLQQEIARLRAELAEVEISREQINDAADRGRREHYAELDRIGIMYADLVASARSAFKVGLSLRHPNQPIVSEA
jgi:hypothetical protein